MTSHNASVPQPRDRSARNQTELEAFTEQARWLIEYHDKRGDSLTARATALLGFCGVILVLLLRSPIPESIQVTCLIQVTGIIAVVSLVLCAFFCLFTMLPGPTTAPGVDELRDKWVGWLDKKDRGKVLGDIADSYLMVNGMPKNYPVGDAYARADRRAAWFITAASFMLIALVGFALLLFLIYQQVN